MTRAPKCHITGASRFPHHLVPVDFPGELDENRLVDSVTGDKLVFRRRGEPEKQHGLAQRRPKRLVFAFDCSRSMARYVAAVLMRVRVRVCVCVCVCVALLDIPDSTAPAKILNNVYHADISTST